MPKKKSENHPTTKYPIQDTPEKERHIGIIVEDYDAKLDLIIENFDTIERRLQKDMNEFKEKVYQKF